MVESGPRLGHVCQDAPRAFVCHKEVSGFLDCAVDFRTFIFGLGSHKYCRLAGAVQESCRQEGFYVDKVLPKLEHTNMLSRLTFPGSFGMMLPSGLQRTSQFPYTPRSGPGPKRLDSSCTQETRKPRTPAV